MRSSNSSKAPKPTDPFRILPPHTAQELAALRASIEAEGLHDPIIVDTEGKVIDGHARRDICIELGIDWLVGADVRIGLTDDQKRAMAISLNLARRSTAPTAKQRREYAATMLLANPDSSDPAISAVVGLSHQTINRIRRQLTQSGKLTPPLRTVGKDGKTRAVSSEKRKARFQVRNKGEFDRLAPVAHELQSHPKLTNGIIRRPNRLPAMLRRNKTLARVQAANPKPLPDLIDIRCCDFRDLKIEPHSVDLICTDVVWGKSAENDWADLGRCAKEWLKPEGVFATFIGNMHSRLFDRAVSPFLEFAWEFGFFFTGTVRNIPCSIIEGWRPIVIYSPSKKVNFHFVKDVLRSNGAEKDFHDWQQPLPIVKELIRRLLPPDEEAPLIVDPHLGTGTSAVACCQLGQRLIGCDIDPNQIEVANYRIATEGINKEVG